MKDSGEIERKRILIESVCLPVFERVFVCGGERRRSIEIDREKLIFKSRYPMELLFNVRFKVRSCLSVFGEK